MEVFRISTGKYASKLTASGGANRWNKRDQYVLYTGSSRSLSTLELIVHQSSITPSGIYKVMVISIADSDYLMKQIFISGLPVDWRTLSAYPALQQIGSDWYNNQESMVLKVPSAVITNEFNYMINIEHPDFKNNVNLVRVEDYYWDDRLFK
jgi:RES domain-containing protein